ncbi:hypothetical protein F5B21DRAFT_271505 [Xylaria acuta]|nr:hypothetical protein F5B21DRAFT_271505 [Xylaria acuta]
MTSSFQHSRCTCPLVGHNLPPSGPSPKQNCCLLSSDWNVEGHVQLVVLLLSPHRLTCTPRLAAVVYLEIQHLSALSMRRQQTRRPLHYMRAFSDLPNRSLTGAGSHERGLHACRMPTVAISNVPCRNTCNVYHGSGVARNRGLHDWTACEDGRRMAQHLSQWTWHAQEVRFQLLATRPSPIGLSGRLSVDTGRQLATIVR